MAACEPWPIDPTVLPAGWPSDVAEWDDGRRTDRDVAQQLLARLVVRRYGLCAQTVRPCSRRCAMLAGYRPAGATWFTPALIGGHVVNGCGCRGGCGCEVRAEVILPGPVHDVLSVRVDGQLVPPAAYRVDDALRLVRTDGGVWPLRQQLDKPDDQAGTFVVEYRRGIPLPAAGRRALTALTVELHKARTGDSSCRLPARVTTVTREGTTYNLLDDPNALYDQGRTGVPEVDAWLGAVNPYKIKSEMAVWSPDLGRTRRTTSPGA